MNLEVVTGQAQRLRLVYRHVGIQRLAGIDDGEFIAPCLSLSIILALRNRAFELLVVIGEESVHCVVDCRTRINVHAGKRRANARIAADMIQMPVRIDHSLDRHIGGVRIIDDALGVFGMAARIDHDQRFASAKDMTFILVGDFDVAQIKPLLAAYLGTLPTPDLHIGYRDVGIRPVKGVVKKEVLAGTEPKSIVSLMFSGPAVWSPAETVRMNALVEVMTLRVNSVLREKRGLIYSGGFQGGVVDVVVAG